jgi:glycosyltransferase involved in cell wall biosynthesis
VRRVTRITVITVCFNSVATIADMLESVAAQIHGDFEHIVVDGASTDGTLSVIRQWQKHPIRLVSEADDGIYDAMNKGLALATGEVVGFLNSDDLYSDSSVLSQVAMAFDDATLDACYADLVYVNKSDDRVIRYWKSSRFKRGAFGLGWCPPHPTFYVRKCIVDKLGGFDESLKIAADVDLMMRYLECGGIRSRYVPRVWVRMRIGGKTNQSVRNIIDQNREVLRTLRANNVPVSVVSFAARKAGQRLRQFVFGFLRNLRTWQM